MGNTLQRNENVSKKKEFSSLDIDDEVRHQSSSYNEKDDAGLQLYESEIDLQLESTNKDRRIDQKNEGIRIHYIKDFAIYEGQMKGDSLEGEGILYINGGHLYCGQFKNNSYEGFGHFYNASGNQHIGYWKHSKMNGNGVAITKTSDVIFGEWKEGNFEPGLNNLDIQFPENLFHLIMRTPRINLLTPFLQLKRDLISNKKQ